MKEQTTSTALHTRERFSKALDPYSQKIPGSCTLRFSLKIRKMYAISLFNFLSKAITGPSSLCISQIFFFQFVSLWILYQKWQDCKSMRVRKKWNEFISAFKEYVTSSYNANTFWNQPSTKTTYVAERS